jgi:hypothetical protein
MLIQQNRTGYSPLYSYNVCVKVAGREVTLKRYQKSQLKGYGRKNVGAGCNVDNDYQIVSYDEDEKDRNKQVRFYKSVNRAKEMIFDVIGCNAGEWKSPDGKKQKVKFVTLTFKGTWNNVAACNCEFTKFIKRLNDAVFNNRGKSELKYMCIPELQGRGTWHYHVIFFNLPPVPQSLRKAFEWCEKGWIKWGNWTNLEDIWGLGFVGINVVDNVTRAAAYISKYLAKGINFDDQGNAIYKSEGEDEGTKRLGDFSLYASLGLENMKRYFCSRGLLRPIKQYISMTKEQHKAMFDAFKRKMALIILNKAGEVIKKKAYENEHRGRILIYNFRLNKNYLKKYMQVIEQFVKSRPKRYLKTTELNYDWKDYSAMRDKTEIARLNMLDWQYKIKDFFAGNYKKPMWTIIEPDFEIEEIFA